MLGATLGGVGAAAYWSGVWVRTLELDVPAACAALWFDVRGLPTTLLLMAGIDVAYVALLAGYYGGVAHEDGSKWATRRMLVARNGWVLFCLVALAVIDATLEPHSELAPAVALAHAGAPCWQLTLRRCEEAVASAAGGAPDVNATRIVTACGMCFAGCALPVDGKWLEVVTTYAVFSCFHLALLLAWSMPPMVAAVAAAAENAPAPSTAPKHASSRPEAANDPEDGTERMALERLQLAIRDTSTPFV